MEKRNKYVGLRYVPKVMGEWDKTIEYEPLMIVTYQGASYTSKNFIPVGIDILNKDYWILTGNYNAQMELLKENFEKNSKNLNDTFTQNYNNVNAKFNSAIDNISNTFKTDINNFKNVVNDFFENPSSFNLPSDSITECSDIFKNIIADCKKTNKPLILKPITYIVNELTVDGIVLDLNGATIKSKTDIIIQNGGSIKNGTILNCGIKSINGRNTIEKITIKDFNTFALDVDAGSYECTINDISYSNETTSINTVGILLNASDNYITHVRGYGAFTGLYIKGGNDNYIDKFHPWINGCNEFNNSIFCRVNATGNFLINSCSDTYNKLFVFDSDWNKLTIDNLNVIHNTDLFKNKSIILSNKDNTLLTGNALVKGTLWKNTDININFINNTCSSLNVSYIDYDGSKNLFYSSDIALNIDKTKYRIDDNSKIKQFGNILYSNIFIYFNASQEINNSPIEIDLTKLTNVKSFSYTGYAKCIADVDGTNVQESLALIVLNDGKITVSSINKMPSKIWSINIDFSTFINVM